jgi:ribosome-associated translation inhibitor RaiA
MARGLLKVLSGANEPRRALNPSGGRMSRIVSSKMKNLFSITSPGVTLNDGVQQDIRHRAAELDRCFDRVTGCDVLVEAPKASARHTDAFGIHIRVSVPGDEFVVSHRGSPELQAAIKEAFDVTGRCLRDYVRVVRGEPKSDF